MKKNLLATLIMLVVILTSLFAGNNKKNELTWYENIEEAMEVASDNDVPILVDFTGSDWCKWCFVLEDEVFSQKEFIDYANENLVLVLLDFPRSKKMSNEQKAYNRNLAEKYNIKGFPTILILDKNSEILGQTGYQRGGAVNYINHLKSIINK